MPDVMKRDIPTPEAGPADVPAALAAFSLTTRAPVPVANMTEANQLAAQLELGEHLQAWPLFVFVEDAQRHLCQAAPGEGWIILGGRLHGAHARVDRTVPNGAVTELHVNTDGFLRQSVGFTRGPKGGVLIPESGLYRVRLGGRVEGITSGTGGRRFVALKVNNTDLGGHVEFEGDTHFKLFDEWPFEKGDEVMPVAYQLTGASRVVTATVGVYQSLDPSW